MKRCQGSFGLNSRLSLLGLPRPATHRVLLKCNHYMNPSVGENKGVGSLFRKGENKGGKTKGSGVFFGKLSPASRPPRPVLVVCVRSLSDMTVLLRRTIRDHLRRSRPRKILNVFQRIHLRFFRACGLAFGRISFASSRRPCRTGS